MTFGVENLTDEQLQEILSSYKDKIPELEERLLESNEADEVGYLSEKISRLNDKQAAIEDELKARGL